MSPPGTHIARWYCPQGIAHSACCPIIWRHAFPGTLSEIEQVVAAVEQASSLEAAADRLRRDDVTLPSALRWVRRRVAPVRTLLTIVVGLLPAVPAGLRAADHRAVRVRLACDEVLMLLRELAAVHLQSLARSARIPTPATAGR